MDEKNINEEEPIEDPSAVDMDSIPDFRSVFCRCCGSEMRHTPLIICSDCLDDEISKFYKAATDEDYDDYDRAYIDLEEEEYNGPEEND